MSNETKVDSGRARQIMEEFGFFTVESGPAIERLDCVWCDQEIGPRDKAVTLDEDGREIVHEGCVDQIRRGVPRSW